MTPQSDHFSPSDDADDQITVVHFTGCNAVLDDSALLRIRDELLVLADEPGNPSLVLDFRNVDYVSSMALGTLVRMQKKLRASGRRMTLVNLSPQVHEVFVVTRLDKFLRLIPADPMAESLLDRPRRRQDRWIEIPLRRSVKHVGVESQAG